MKRHPFLLPPARFARVAAVTAGAALVLASCTSGSADMPTVPTSVAGGPAPSGPTVVTPREARSVVAPTMTRNNEANSKLDDKLLSTYEAGSAYSLDSASYVQQRLVKAATGSDPLAAPFTDRLGAVGVGRQPAFPAQFLAVGNSESLPSKASSPTCGSLLDFSRSSATSRWRIVNEPGTLPGAVPSLALRDGYLARLSQTAVRNADALPATVARDLIDEETGASRKPFTRADFQGNRCWGLPDPRADVVGAAAGGYAQRDFFSVRSPADTVAYPLANGGTLVLFTIDFHDQMLGGSAGAINWSHPSLQKSPSLAWMDLIARGSYEEVDESGEIEIAATIPKAGSRAGAPFAIIGDYEGVTGLSGRKAKGTATTGGGGTLTGFRLPS